MSTALTVSGVHTPSSLALTAGSLLHLYPSLAPRQICSAKPLGERLLNSMSV